MLIKRIRIQNYRSIKRVDIQPGDIVTLVGPNDSGKTNILSAINFLLGDRYPTRQGLDLTDFYNKDLNRDIQIQIWFNPNPDQIETIWVTCPGNEGKLQAKFRRTTMNGDQFLSNEVRDRYAIVYLDAARNFDSQFSSSRWSLFGRIVRQLDEHFRNSIPQDIQKDVQDNLAKAQELLKTPLYREFENAIAESFDDQVRRTTHRVELNFRTFDPLNFYKSLYPILIEGTEHKNPSEAGSGMRNLIVMALFRAYARAFRGNAVIAIEEPEIYLHPHAQRSLAALFQELADNGSQVFYSTHSAAFINVARSDRVVLVERCFDKDDDLCTQVRTVSSEEILRARKNLYPNVPMTIMSMRERYRNICGLEHAEAFFSRAILLVEGPTEKEAIPIYARHIGIDFDSLGISAISANGKGNIDQLFQLYKTHGFPVFVVFDNDRGGDKDDIRVNLILTRMLELPETDMPDAAIGDYYCIIDKNYENTIKDDLDKNYQGLYEKLKAEAVETLGKNAGKALVARYMAGKLAEQNIIPHIVAKILDAIKKLISPKDQADECLATGSGEESLWDDDVPF